MIKNILWDFDGVIMDSNATRDLGFEKVLSEFPEYQVEELLSFHRANGGLSRYVKFRYFFEEIRKESISDERISFWAEKFSLIMKDLLIDPKLLINDTIDFIKNNHDKYKMHIVSGSDEKELRYLCHELSIDSYFLSINGSPTPKIKLIENLLNKFNYETKDCCLIGDSMNDFEASDINKIMFFGYNNKDFLNMGMNYIFELKDFSF